MYPHYYGPGPMHHAYGGILMGILPLLVIVLIVLLAYRLLSQHGRQLWHNQTNPLEAAKLRYAKGDIDKAEFEQIKKDLKD